MSSALNPPPPPPPPREGGTVRVAGEKRPWQKPVLLAHDDLLDIEGATPKATRDENSGMHPHSIYYVTTS